MKLVTQEDLINGINTKSDIPLSIQDELRFGNYRYIIDSAHDLKLYSYLNL